MNKHATAMLLAAVLSTVLPAFAEGHFGGGRGGGFGEGYGVGFGQGRGEGFGQGHAEGFGQGRAEGLGEGHHGMHFGRSRWEGERDIRHFDDRHLSVWREGGWRHVDHDGVFGWWWIAADTWYFYPAPIYPYPNPYIPSVMAVPQLSESGTLVQPPSQSWYYCQASNSYYPYVPSCPTGWKMIPATPPQGPATPPSNASVPPGGPSY